MSPVTVSPDGRWWWDGTRWQSRVVEGELELFWFTSTPQWFERVLVTGLIGLIPIVGSINMYGWTLAGVDMLRQRWRELPPHGFQYLERGVAPFVVYLVWGLAAVFVLASLAVGAVALLASKPSQVAAGLSVIALIVLLAIAWALTLLFLMASILILSDRAGIGHAISPVNVVRAARRNGEVSLHAGLLYLGGSIVIFVGGLFLSFVPFASLLAGVALPAVMALVMPALSRFEVGEVGPPAPAAPR